MTLIELLAATATLICCSAAYHYHRQGKALQSRLGKLENANSTLAQELAASRHLETELRDKTLFHETLLNALKDAGFQLMLLENGRIVYVGNRQLAHIAGWSDAEIDARPALLDIIHPDDRARVADNYRRRVAGEPVPARYEVALHNAAGQRVDYEVAIALAPGNDPIRVVTVSWEIGDRKRAERDLLLLRRAIDHTTESYFLMDDQWRIIDANAAACTSLGYRRKELLGLTPMDFSPDITRQQLDAQTNTGPGPTHTFETRHRSRNGHLFPCEVSSSIFIEGGRYHAMFICRDISERKRLEAKTAQQERDFRTLVENLPVAVIRYDPWQRRRYLNPAAERMLRNTADNLLGHPPGYPDLPVTPAMLANYRQRIREVLEGGGAREMEFVLDALPSDRQQHYEVRFVAEQDMYGASSNALAIWYDITERKQAEARLRDSLEFNTGIINAIPDILFEMNRQGRYLNIWSRNPVQLAAQKNTLLGRTVSEILDPEAAEAAMHAIEEADRNGSAYGHVFVIRQANGEQRWFEHSLTKKHGRTPVEDSFIVLSRDITERNSAELAREAALTESARLANLRSTFMAQMSHELRTPLNGILGYTQLMQEEEGLSDELHNWLDIIRKNGEHLLKLINQVLDFSRVESGKLPLNLEYIRLVSLIEELNATIRISAEKKNLDFVVTMAADLPSFIRTDTLRLRQILLNLLGNAVKFTHHGRIDLKASQPVPGRIRFDVQDTGVGIRAENLQRIFESFEQIEEDTRLCEGTGLGLAISQKLARMMGSEISVSSQYGKGSTFTFELDATISEVPASVQELAETPSPEEMAALDQSQLPPVTELADLLELARSGYLHHIIRRAAKLESEYTEFADHLTSLARSYRSRQLQSYLQQCHELQTGN